MLQADPHQFSWLREVGIPALFLVLGTGFGAGLSFVASEKLEARKAKRDAQKEKRAKDSFLRAVGMELDALSDQLDGSLHEVKASTDRVTGGSGTGPQFAAALRTAVFTTQVAKLRDVDDPLLIAVVHYYSDLGTLQHILEMVNDLSAEFTRADAFSGQKDSVRPRLLSTLIELQNQISIFGNRLRKLRAKLPPAGTPDK
jgi:hypothetical protein